MEKTNPYKILGLKSDVSLDEITAAFRHKVKKLHPDINPKTYSNPLELNYLLKA